jgi:hypothetical protein
VARVLIVGGGCRGKRLAGELVADGFAARITTRTDAGRTTIEASGAECWIGTPDRLATLRGALDGVSILCWLLGTATGTQAQLRELHSSRLQFFLTQAIDTTVRGFVYEARGSSTLQPALAAGERLVQAWAQQNSIPTAFLRADPHDHAAWAGEAREAIESLLCA